MIDNKYCQIIHRSDVKSFIFSLRSYFFPGYFEDCLVEEKDFRQQKINDIKSLLKKMIPCEDNLDGKIEEFINSFKSIEKDFSLDIDAFFVGDPASHSKDEIILTYPGFYALSIFRLAHQLYVQSVELLPRMMTEIAHSKTGIDINPGATIGKSFFIDHGTGVVIGETTVIGNNVRIYQGVTLGALSLGKGRLLKNTKRHPTVGDNVIIYSGSSILGGDTVIGDNVVIGSNVFITSSIPSNTKVLNEEPRLIVKENKTNKI